jgi:cardiolipin synthase
MSNDRKTDHSIINRYGLCSLLRMKHPISSSNSLYHTLFLSGSAIRLVNLITLYRILAAPVLLFILFSNALSVFKWLLLLSFFTDMLDGYLARKFNAGTTIGATLDSIGDLLTIVVAITGVVYTRPEFIVEQSVIITSICSLYIFHLFFAFFRYKKLSSFHTYLAKAAAVIQGTFFLTLFFFSDVLYPLFYVASFLTITELIEEIILIYLIPQWKINVKGLYWYMINKTI